MNYKKYRVYINTPAGGYYAATSNTVNNLVGLTKYWLERTSAGMYLPSDVKGSVVLQLLDETNGSYKAEELAPFDKKEDIINALRSIGGR